MKKIFLFFLILGLFISVPVFADDITIYDLGLYDYSADLPPFPDELTGTNYPYYLVYFNTNSGINRWGILCFNTIEGLSLDGVDFDSSSNDYFCLKGDDGDDITDYHIYEYKLVDGEWDKYPLSPYSFSESKLWSKFGSALNFTNFDIDCGDYTVVANPISAGVPMILQSHLPRLLQTIMTAGLAVLPKALLILGILLGIGLIPRLIRSLAH